MTALTDRELTRVLKSHPVTSKRFAGVFALDELNNIDLSRKPCFCIVNSQKRSLGGLHWKLLYFEKNDSEIFDSLGERENQTPILRFLENHSPVVRYNSCPIQSPLSSDCGRWCAVMALHRSMNRSMEDFLRQFSKWDLQGNDVKIRILYSFEFRTRWS